MSKLLITLILFCFFIQNSQTHSCEIALEVINSDSKKVDNISLLSSDNAVIGIIFGYLLHQDIVKFSMINKRMLEVYNKFCTNNKFFHYFQEINNHRSRFVHINELTPQFIFVRVNSIAFEEGNRNFYSFYNEINTLFDKSGHLEKIVACAFFNNRQKLVYMIVENFLMRAQVCTKMLEKMMIQFDNATKNQMRSQIIAQIFTQLMDAVGHRFGPEIWIELWSQIPVQILSQVEDKNLSLDWTKFPVRKNETEEEELKRATLYAFSIIYINYANYTGVLKEESIRNAIKKCENDLPLTEDEAKIMLNEINERDFILDDPMEKFLWLRLKGIAKHAQS